MPSQLPEAALTDLLNRLAEAPAWAAPAAEEWDIEHEGRRYVVDTETRDAP